MSWKGSGRRDEEAHGAQQYNALGPSTDGDIGASRLRSDVSKGAAGTMSAKLRAGCARLITVVGAARLARHYP